MMARRYHRWTPAEDAFLRENGYKGVRRCVADFNRTFGLRMKRSAVKKHASRRGISLMGYSTCAECGKPMPKDRPDGLCLVCHERSMAGPASEQRASLMRRMTYTPEEQQAIEDARRRRAVLRQRKHREKARGDKAENG